MCRIAIEDVFLPANKLTIGDVGFSETSTDIQIPVEYSIVDATGKRVNDIAICTFDKAGTEPKQIKAIIQFNNEIPAPYVQFINKRVARKMLIASGQKPPAEPETAPPVIIPQNPPAAAESPSAMPANIPPPPSK